MPETKPGSTEQRKPKATDPASNDRVPSDRERWNARYSENPRGGAPHPWLVEHADSLPPRGRALDVAGGSGASAVWLAQRGLEVTLVDVSDVALAEAARAAAAAGVSVNCVERDLVAQHPASAPVLGDGFALISCTRYFQPDLFGWFATALAPGGLFLFAQPTLENLQRNPRPSARFLVDSLQFDLLLRQLDVLERVEGWTPAGTHELWLLARRAQ